MDNRTIILLIQRKNGNYILKSFRADPFIDSTIQIQRCITDIESITDYGTRKTTLVWV
jgi:hypothetical protein